MGKKSLQNWRKTRLQQLTAQPSGRDQDSELLCDNTASQGKHGDIPQAAVFNADLLCEHGEKLLHVLILSRYCPGLPVKLRERKFGESTVL